MDKQVLMLVLNECFNEEGNFANLHFMNGSELIVDNRPEYFSSHMKVNSSYELYGETVNEGFIIPYSSVLYVTLSNVENLRILAKQYEPLRTEDVSFRDKLTEDIG